MKRSISMILVAIFLFAAIPVVTEQSAQAFDYSTVRVLLSNGGTSVNTISISVRGNYFIQENGASFSGGTLTVQNTGGKIVLSHSSKGQLYAGSSVNVMCESYSSASMLSMVVSGKTRSYVGNFLFKTQSSGIRVVNTVPLNYYLYGVVAFEMSNAFPIEALKAQAIAAKCYVLSGLAPSSDYDIGDTASDQVYKGYNSSYTAVMQAVDQTYDIWLFLGNSILCSYFAASNGGQTILPSDTWTGIDRTRWDAAYTRVQDPYDIANPLTVQETTFYPTNGDNGSISAALSNYLRNRSTDILRKQHGDPGLVVTRIDAIHSMTSRSSTTADINLTVTAQFGNGSVQSLNYAYTEDFAYLVANGVFTKPQSLRLYTLTQTNSGWELRRGRYGHGVGLSQRGAEQMANQGIKYDKILNFYYPGAALRTMGLQLPTDPVNSSAGASQQIGSPTATAVTTGNVALRQGPSASTTKLDTIPKGTDLYVYGQDSGFCLVQYNGQTGYTSNTYLKITPISTTQTQDPSGGTSITAFAEVTSSTLNLRDKPATSGKKLSTLKKGDKLDVYGFADSSNSWYYVAHGSTVGYVSAQYIKITGTPTTTTAPESNASGAAVGAGSTGTITTDGIYMRSKASTSSGQRVAQLAKGVIITITGTDGDFYACSLTYNGETFTGYVQKSYVSVTASSGGTTIGTTTTQEGKTTGKVNLRKGPGTSYGKITQLKKGVKLTIHSYGNGWYEVTADGQKGYVSGDYVSVTGGSSTPTTTTTSTGVVIIETTRLRSTPTTSSAGNILGEYPVGTAMTILGSDGEFYRVSINGQEGYMHMSYVQITGQSTSGSASSGTDGTTSGRVNLRSGPSTSSTKVIKVLSKGTKLTILGTEGEFYKVQVGSDTGYVSSKYVRKG